MAREYKGSLIHHEFAHDTFVSMVWSSRSSRTGRMMFVHTVRLDGSEVHRTEADSDKLLADFRRAHFDYVDMYLDSVGTEATAAA